MPQSPMISSPLKQTTEIDWIEPLKAYIRDTYQDDPERYSEECATLNRLRQDMRGAGKDSAAGRDLLYRYYGQLELLDLRFPVDENHIKISFTWFDAFTHKPISQYSLAYEKASIIFNISAVLSCHAANQNRSDDVGLKTAYHSFQASAGMFNYINENFLHAPSVDLSRDTVKTLISITLAQGQEVFLEKQIADGKKVGLLAKLASQAATLYGQAVEGATENVAKSVFDKSWLTVVQTKSSHMTSLSQYYQAIADEDANAHGTAIARLQVAERAAKEATAFAASFPSTAPPASNLSSETRSNLNDMVKRHLSNIQERLASVMKDNDFIYHQTVPAEASLSVIPKLPAAKAIPVSDLYQGQDIQRIIGPDIFQRIVPMSVTESASLYDEEKAKLVRAEVEKVEQANDEMAASLDYLKLPGSLNVLKGGMDQEATVDEEFRVWCEELAGHEPFTTNFEHLKGDKSTILSILDTCNKQLDLEENVCEKMRVKYTGDWTQQPSSRLNSTLRSDIRGYREAVDQASGSDAQLMATAKQYEADFEEMKSAGETDEADILYQRAMIKAGGSRGKGKSTASPSAEGNLLDDDYSEGGPSVMDQIANIEDMLKKLNLVKKDRAQVLKDLKEKAHNDDISNVLILNKKSIANHEAKLFESELEKFRSHQNRLLQANHKQTSLMKELTRSYGDLLQDKRVRSEQAKYDNYTRQRNNVLNRYRKVFNAYNDLMQGLGRAQTFYTEMRETVENLEKNVETFVNNRREEGAQMLSQIERKKQSAANETTERDNDRLRDMMERMNVNSSPPQRTKSSASRPTVPLRPQQPPSQGSQASGAYPASGYPIPPQSPPYNAKPPSTTYPMHQQPQPPMGYPGGYPPANGSTYPDPHRPREQTATYHPGYDPTQYPYQPPRSPPANQGMYPPNMGFPPFGHQQLPQGYVPPPPPPGPPPSGQGFPYGPGLPPHPHAQPQQQPQQPPSRPGGGGSGPGGGQQDPWAGLGAWKS